MRCRRRCGEPCWFDFAFTTIYGEKLRNERFSLVPGTPQRLDDIASGVELHGNCPFVAQLRQLAIDVEVVDLAGAGFVTSGNVGNVYQAHLVYVGIEFLDQISELTLGLPTAFTISNASVTPSR